MSEKEYKDLYKSLEPIYCPALQEMVYFNSSGLNHLYYKNFRRRSYKEVIRRLGLVPYLHEVISKSSHALQRTKSDHGNAETWSLEYTVAKEDGTKSRIRVVIIRKKPNARLYFLSVMDYAN